MNKANQLEEIKKPEQKEKTENALVIVDPQDLQKPKKDTQFAHNSAKFLVDIIKKNNWAKRLGGQSDHIQYEGWQTAGKYYGYSVKTFGTEYIEYSGTWGFKAKSVVVNERTGIEVGGAEALCMSDEQNWKNKPKFQLASMAQTRAGSKALRQILGFVVALAGYNPTPLEEMTNDENNNVTIDKDNFSRGDPSKEEDGNGRTSHHHLITNKQITFLFQLLAKKGYTKEQLLEKYNATVIEGLTSEQASIIISNLLKLPDKSYSEQIADDASKNMEEGE